MGFIYLLITSTFIINFFVLLFSSHNPWIIVIVINYIDNKRNSIAIHFFCVVISISTIGGWGGLDFFLLS